MSDLIEREDAIKALRHVFSTCDPCCREEAVDIAVTTVEAIPSARPKEDTQKAYDIGFRKGKEAEHRWWSKLCANCDGAIDEPQPPKILEAYAKGYKDGADAVKPKDEPQTCSVNGRPYSECADCEHFRCAADEPQTSCKTCSYGEVDEGYVRCAYYSKSAEQDEPQLVKDLVKAFCEDGTWLERQGVYTLTLAEAKQRAVDIIESVLAKDEQTEREGE